MNYKDLFAKIYVDYGKKYFQDGQELLDCVKKVDPEIPIRQYTVIDYLTRQNNIEKLMAVRFESEAQQEIVLNQIAIEMSNDYFVPKEETIECGKAFLAVFQHGSRARMNELEEEYDESLAPTMAMEPIDINNLDQAPLLAEMDEEEDILEIPEEDTSQQYAQDVLMTQRVFAPKELKDLEEEDAEEPEEETPAPKPVKMKKVKSKKTKASMSKPIEEVQSTKKAGKASTIVLIVLFALLLICIGVLFFILKDMGMI